ncbi:MAG: hypothetical protein ACK5N4_03985 [Parabacteroides gordonii]|uniref:hypothetical protein n=1 Tax=Parabacteroides gordonii TaxID=574930 RepID=UPI003A8451FB
MEKEIFKITEEELFQLKKLHPNMGKNNDIGCLALEIAKRYYKKKFGNINFVPVKDVDLCFEINGEMFEYEIKGTTDNDIAWGKLKVSSKNCHDRLESGMPMIRITNIGKTEMVIYTLKFGEDFILKQEDRWAVCQTKPPFMGKAPQNPPIDEVRGFIRQQICNARKMKFKELILQSGDIHKELCMVKALPTVCSAMKTLGVGYPYEIVSQPPKGMGTKLFIKYKL